jgi:Taurine catabolism dioxygenase TauD, TfdA family
MLSIHYQSRIGHVSSKQGRDCEVFHLLIPTRVHGGAQNLRSILFYEQDHVICSFDPSPLHQIHKMTNCPSLTTQQTEAIDILQKTAKKHTLQVKLKAGDLVFFNNFAIFHSRQDYEDNEHKKRHIVRLWLRNDEIGWPIPKKLFNSWDYTFSTPKEEELFLVEPKPYVKIPKISLNSACVNLVDEEVA